MKPPPPRRLWIPLLLLAASSLGAQQPSVRLEAAAACFDATGDLGLYLGAGHGAAAALHLRRPGTLLGLRLDAAYRAFPAVTRTRPWGSSGTIPLFVQTGAHLLTVLGGPEITLERGRLAVSLATAFGVASYGTTSALATLGDSARMERGTSFNGLVPAAEAIAEIGWRVAGTESPVWVAASLGYLATGDLDLVREGNVPVGVISGAYLNPTPTPGTLLGVRVGVVIGPRR